MNAAPLFVSFTFPGPGNQSSFSCKWNLHVRPGRRTAAGIHNKKCYKDKKLHAWRVGPVCRSGTQPPPTPTHRPDTLPPPVMCRARRAHAEELTRAGLAVCRDSVGRLQRHRRCWAPCKIERRTSEKDQNMLDFRVDPAQSRRKGLKWAQSAVRWYMAWKSQQGCAGSLKWTSGGTLLVHRTTLEFNF